MFARATITTEQISEGLRNMFQWLWISAPCVYFGNDDEMLELEPLMHWQSMKKQNPSPKEWQGQQRKQGLERKLKQWLQHTTNNQYSREALAGLASKAKDIFKNRKTYDVKFMQFSVANRDGINTPAFALDGKAYYPILLKASGRQGALGEAIVKATQFIEAVVSRKVRTNCGATGGAGHEKPGNNSGRAKPVPTTVFSAWCWP